MTHLSDQNRALVERMGADYGVHESTLTADLDLGDFGRLLDAARAEGRDQVSAKIAARKAIYEQKASEADPLADDDCNRHERMTHTVEAFTILQDEVGQGGLSALARDAARYRWIRENMPWDDEYRPPEGDDLDSQVDGEIMVAALQAATGCAPPHQSPWTWNCHPPSVATPAQGMVEGKITYPEGWVAPWRPPR